MALQALLAVMAIDIITGLMVALVWKKSGKSETGAADSRAMFKGLCRKVVIVLVVFVAQQMPNVLRLMEHALQLTQLFKQA